MKFRKILFVSAFCLALAASFAFKSAKETTLNVTFWPPAAPWECAYGPMEQGDCSKINTGAQCTVYDWTAGGGTYVPAYNGDNDTPCYWPLYHQF